MQLSSRNTMPEGPFELRPVWIADRNRVLIEQAVQVGRFPEESALGRRRELFGR